MQPCKGKRAKEERDQQARPVGSSPKREGGKKILAKKKMRELRVRACACVCASAGVCDQRAGPLSVSINSNLALQRQAPVMKLRWSASFPGPYPGPQALLCVPVPHSRSCTEISIDISFFFPLHRRRSISICFLPSSWRRTCSYSSTNKFTSIHTCRQLRIRYWLQGRQ